MKGCTGVQLIPPGRFPISFNKVVVTSVTPAPSSAAQRMWRSYHDQHSDLTRPLGWK